MRKNVLVVFGLLILLVNVGSIFGKTISSYEQTASIKVNKITLEQARKIALKAVSGEIVDEYELEEEEEGEVIAYAIYILTKDDKLFEVQIDADNGDVLSKEEVTDEYEEEDPSFK